jgi:hypothetical protein
VTSRNTDANTQDATLETIFVQDWSHKLVHLVKKKQFVEARKQKCIEKGETNDAILLYLLQSAAGVPLNDLDCHRVNNF